MLLRTTTVAAVTVWACGWAFSPGLAGAGETPPAGLRLENPFFAFDNCLHGPDYAAPEVRAKTLKEFGYAGMSVGGTALVPALVPALKEQGLQLFAIYTPAWLDSDKPPYDPALRQTLQGLRGSPTQVWLHVMSKEFKPSTTTGDDRAVAVVREVAEIARASGLRVALYPHTGFYVATVGDALRLAEKVDRPNVGVTFNLCHYLKQEPEGAWAETLRRALPRLFLVSVNGADAGGGGKFGWDRLIQTLDRGSFDVGPVLLQLKQMGYTGPIGVQGYGLKGDPRDELQRTMGAWKALQARVAAGR